MMQQTAILYPIAAMVLLTIIVAMVMLRSRIQEMKTQRIHPQSTATRAQSGQLLKNASAADNYQNLYEMPVQFYVLCLALLFTQTVSPWMLAAAWIYVLLRCAHSYIHCTSNHVMTRFKFFAGSAMVLAAMWLAFVVQLLMR